MSADSGLRLLVCDLDGTLLEADGSVSPRTSAAVAALRSAGVEVALATGRVPIGVTPIVTDLGLEGPQITMHGGLVVDPRGGDAVYSETLAPAQVDELLDIADDLALPVLLCYPHGFRTRELTQELIDLFVPFREPPPLEVTDLRALRESAPHKVAIWTGADRYEAALARCRERLGDRYAITSGDNRSIELLPPGVDKGRAAAALAGWMGIPMSDVAAIGDGTNDIELLAAAGSSVAMRHARSEVRAAADAVIPDGAPDEIATAIGMLFPDLDLDPAEPRR